MGGRSVARGCSHLNAMFGVGYAVGCHRRVVADLFGDECCLACIVLPAAQEELS
jgi:hypothetical protein